MSRIRNTCITSFLVISGLVMAAAIFLGVSMGVLENLTTDMDSLRILLMIYASYPLFMILLLWPGEQGPLECGLLITGGLLLFGCAVYSWGLVAAADPGAVPALIMAWYGLLQSLVVAVLFILLALIRMLQARKIAVT